MTKWKTMMWVVVVLLFVSVGGFAWMKYMSIQKALQEIHTPMEKRELLQKEKQSDVQQKPFSVLLLGVDERKGDVGRSDTMIVVTVNPVKKSVKMLSIPRDTKVEIVGNRTVEKINHAYARGGIPMTVATVEKFLDIPIDYYVKINMEGFLKIVDVLGGITVQNDMALSTQNYNFPKGEIVLNSQEALIFSRIRHEDPRGDFGRQIRQKQIIEAILKKSTQITMLWKMDDIIQTIKGELKTNFTFSQLLQMKVQYEDLTNQIEQLNFKKGKNEYVNHYWYYFPDPPELKMLKSKLQQHLAM